MKIKIIAFFKLVRWFHEVVVILPFLTLYLVINYYSFKSNIICNNSGFNFFILCVTVQTLIAAGCVLNDIVDRDIDKINKPVTRVVGNTISIRDCKIIFLILSLIILFLSIYLSTYVFREWAYIAIIVYIFSLLYDFYFKRSPLLGNILMGLLTAFIPLILLYYCKDCLDALNNYKVNLLIYLFAGLPFLIIIPRELSLDISDIEGDKACGCKTLPIIIGVKKSKLVIMSFLLLIILISIPLSLKFHHLIFPFIIIDVLLFTYISQLFKAKERIEYIKIGRFLWFVMIVGLILFTLATVI